MTGETRPDNGTLVLWDERGRKRAQIDVRERQVVTRAWDEEGREERYEDQRQERDREGGADDHSAIHVAATRSTVEVALSAPGGAAGPP